MDWEQYERAVVEKFSADFPSPQFRVEPSGPAKFYLLGRHSKERRQLDAAVFRRNEDRPFLVADAKRWNSKLDITDVEQFISFVDDIGAEIGVLVASSGFSDASERRAVGATSAIRLEVMSLQEAQEWDWIGLGRTVFPWDWIFHVQIGQAIRLIEKSANVEAIADALEEVAFEEWEEYVRFAIQKHPDEAAQFMAWVAMNHTDDGWRFHGARHLAEMGRLTDAIRSHVIALESDPEIRTMLAVI